MQVKKHGRLSSDRLPKGWPTLILRKKSGGNHDAPSCHNPVSGMVDCTSILIIKYSAQLLILRCTMLKSTMAQLPCSHEVLLCFIVHFKTGNLSITKHTPYFPVVLETNQIVMSTPKQLDAAVAHDLTWKLNCIVWASVDQQDRKKPYAKADSDAMRGHSLQASHHALYSAF